MTSLEKLSILANAAKYDASCSSSGSARANSPGGLGSGSVAGICHSWAADGRCISLLKVLLSNACSWDCAYCVNRKSNDVPRASFSPEELAELIIGFYTRNYIEGALISSAVMGSADNTMDRLVRVAKLLRQRHHFNGYLHLKIIPGSSNDLVLEAARWADRVSVNIELPSAKSLEQIAPDKTPTGIFSPMKSLAAASGFSSRLAIAQNSAASVKVPLPLESPEKTGPQIATPQHETATQTTPSPAPKHDIATHTPHTFTEALPGGTAALSPEQAAEPRPLYEAPATSKQSNGPVQRTSTATHYSVMEARKSRYRNPEAVVLPAGQTTQMVIGASPESDACILTLAERLYLGLDVRRVYYSAYIPVSHDSRLPAPKPAPLIREHRLYQADWLFRFYGFTAGELFSDSRQDLDTELDPKCAWALQNLQDFPVEVMSADYATLLRVPGLGPTSASRILKARRHHTLTPERLAKLGVVLKRARWFLCCRGQLVSTLMDRWECAADKPDLLRRLLLDGMDARLHALQPEFDWNTP